MTVARFTAEAKSELLAQIAFTKQSDKVWVLAFKPKWKPPYFERQHSRTTANRGLATRGDDG